MKKIFTCFLIGLPFWVTAQLFTEVTDDSNALVDAPGATNGSYTGCSFIDYNNDGWLDVFWVRGGLFLNDGAGSFTKILSSNLKTDSGFGNTWADYDNDGYIDCFISGGSTRGSTLHKNNGDGTFSKIIVGALADSTTLRGWGCAWGDMNNDTWVDLVIAAPLGFAGITDSNKLLLNENGINFSRLDTALICIGTAPYTVPSWSDYDMDGDMDCFIGSGPANGTVMPDYLYNNQFAATGAVGYFKKITTNPIATDNVDGQIWNWIDYDNDGDLDAYLTNYVGTSGGVGMQNNLYRNNGGTFTRMTSAEVGNIVSDQGLSLSSVWEDFDNDGDIDCFVTNDASSCKYYQNNNDGTFTSITTEEPVENNGSYYGTSAGDYDKDGDVDLFVVGAGSGKALYNNNASSNGNGWVNFKLTGNGPGLIIGSNLSAIGARVNVKAKINGTDVWQLREVSAQNSFNSMNSLNVEFGLGDATIIDSLIIFWPSGAIDKCANIAINNYYDVQETFCPVQVNIPEINNISVFGISPNPSSDNFVIKYQISVPSNIELFISDSMGRRIETLFTGNQNNEIQTKNWNASKYPVGIYYCTLRTETNFSVLTLEIQK